MTVQISKPAINLREELASLRDQGGLPKEDKLYLDDLVTNGDFSNGTTGWETAPAATTLTVSSGVATLTRNDNYGDAKQYIKTEVGKTYRLTYTVTAVSNSYAVDFGSAQHTSNAITGTRVLYHTATSDSTLVKFGILNSSTGTLTFDNVSVQEVGENLVTNGTFDNGTTGWTDVSSGSGTVSHSSGAVNLVGTDSSNRGRISQTISSLVVGKTYVIIFESTVSSGNYNMTGLPLGSQVNLGSGLKQYTFIADAVTDTITFETSSSGGNISLDNIIVTEGNHQVIQSIPYGYDVKDVYIDGELAREGEAYDYQVKTDGINQWLKPTVEPTATTETVVIGVRNGS